MSIGSGELYDVINKYIALIESRTDSDAKIKEIDRNTKTFLTNVVKNEPQTENIREIQKRIKATPKSGIDGNKLKDLKMRIDNLTNQLDTTSQDGSISNRKRKAPQTDKPTTYTNNSNGSASLGIEAAKSRKVSDKDDSSLTENRTIDEITDIVGQYIALIKDRISDDHEIIDDDKLVKRHLTALAKGKPQNEDIIKIKKFIDSTEETGLNTDKLREIKTRIAELANQSEVASQDSVHGHKRKSSSEEEPVIRSEDLTMRPYKMPKSEIKVSENGELISFRLPEGVAEITGAYAIDPLDIIRELDNGRNIDSFKAIAEQVTVLDLRPALYSDTYSVEITNLPRILEIFKNVEVLTMPVMSEGKYLEAVGKLKNLLTLDIDSCSIQDADLANLSKLTKLQNLNLRCCFDITDIGLASIVSLTSLQSLNLTSCKITDTGLASITALTSLETLILNSCGQITDNGLASITALKSLKTLSLDGCSEITDTGLASITALTSLETLILDRCTKITDNGLAVLRTLTSLQSLNLNGCIRITGTGFTYLASLRSLQSLGLRGCNITNEDLAFLKALTSLQSLDLSSCDITNKDLAFLMSLKSLQRLDLSWCDITDTDFAHAKEINPNILIKRSYKEYE